MKVAFLIDAQLPPRLAAALRERGYDAEHVVEIGFGAASDDEIAARALSRNSVIVTKDADFAMIGRRAPTLRVLWVRFGNASFQALAERLLPRLPEIAAAFEAGERIIELR